MVQLKEPAWSVHRPSRGQNADPRWVAARHGQEAPGVGEEAHLPQC